MTFRCWDTKKLMFISLICSHFVDRFTVCTSFGLFILGYFINMHYGHIASDKGASICERRVLSFVIRVLRRTFHSAIWSINDSHFVNYGMIFVFSHVGVVYKSNYNLKTSDIDTLTLTAKPRVYVSHGMSLLESSMWQWVRLSLPPQQNSQ